MKMSIKSALLIATALGFATLPAMAQDSGEPMKAPAAGGGQEQGRGPGQGQGQGQKFEDVKANILQRMKDRQACVEAAADFQALRPCMQGPGGGMGGGMMGGGMGGRMGDGPGPGGAQGGPSGAPSGGPAGGNDGGGK